MEVKKQIISKWKKRNKDGERLQQVVILTENGKTVKGKKKYRSQTRHIPV